jgi:hypothetical protein
MTFMIEINNTESILERLPFAAQKWAESLPWNERRYLLSLCHLMCASSPDIQAKFLDDYTANGLVNKLVEDRENYHRVIGYIQQFKIPVSLDESLIRDYIRQFYIHSAQKAHVETSIYLESALKLLYSNAERNHVLNYILGFEVLKMIFQMSWSQQERLYQLQKNQTLFLQTYIKPIQYTHKVNGIIRPDRKGTKNFFQRRDFFIQNPNIAPTKLLALTMATFNADTVTNLGFGIIRHPNYLVFDYDYIFHTEEERFM